MPDEDMLAAGLMSGCCLVAIIGLLLKLAFWGLVAWGIFELVVWLTSK